MTKAKTGFWRWLYHTPKRILGRTIRIEKETIVATVIIFLLIGWSLSIICLAASGIALIIELFRIPVSTSNPLLLKYFGFTFFFWILPASYGYYKICVEEEE